MMMACLLQNVSMFPLKKVGKNSRVYEDSMYGREREKADKFITK